MTKAPTSQPEPTSRATVYEICLDGRLASRWQARFDGLTIATRPDGVTVLHGPVIDQASLFGILRQVRDTGIPLISVNRRVK